MGGLGHNIFGVGSWSMRCQCLRRIDPICWVLVLKGTENVNVGPLCSLLSGRGLLGISLDWLWPLSWTCKRSD